MPYGILGGPLRVWYMTIGFEIVVSVRDGYIANFIG